MAGNMLSGTIPSDIGDRFSSIEFLGFTDNRFSGVIPSSLSNLSTLKYLDLTDNNFTGYVPPALGRLQGLIQLYLNGNKLEAYDKEGWEKYFDMLVTNRFNRFNLSFGLAYDFSGEGHGQHRHPASPSSSARWG